jgi:hypothetical protein
MTSFAFQRCVDTEGVSVKMDTDNQETIKRKISIKRAQKTPDQTFCSKHINRAEREMESRHWEPQL